MSKSPIIHSVSMFVDNENMHKLGSEKYMSVSNRWSCTIKLDDSSIYLSDRAFNKLKTIIADIDRQRDQARR